MDPVGASQTATFLQSAGAWGIVDLLIPPASAQTAEALHAASQAGDQLTSMGPFGALLVLIFLAAAVAIVMLWRDGVAMRKQLAELHEKRVTEVAALAANTATGLTTSSSAINAANLIANSGNGLLQKVLDVVQPLAPAIEVVSRQCEANTRQLEANAQKMDRLQDTVLRGDRS